MRFTAKFSTSVTERAGAGSLDRNTGIVYYPFDIPEISNASSLERRDKAVANAVQTIADSPEFRGCELVEVLVGHFLPPHYYMSEARQMQNEANAKRITLYEYRLSDETRQAAESGDLLDHGIPQP